MGMKKALKKIAVSGCYYFVNGNQVEGIHKNLSGDVSYLRGNVSNLIGDVSNLSGNVDDCEITDEEREKGINILDLIGEEV
jgi:hypothetical protein